MLKAILKVLMIGLMVGLFSASIACAVYAYRTWRGSAVTIHPGPRATQRKAMPLSREDSERVHALLSGAAVSGIVALGLLFTLTRRSRRRKA